MFCVFVYSQAVSLRCFIVAILLVTTFAQVQSQLQGAPRAACGTTTDIAPLHVGVSASTSPLPYSVDLSDFTDGEYIPGATYQSKE